MKAIVIGAGSFAQKHAGILAAMPDVTVAGFCSRTLEHAKKAAAKLEEGQDEKVAAFDELERALDELSPDVAVVAVTPNAHGATELELIKRGIHFLIEKPIGIDRETPQKIQSALAETDLVTSVGFHFRYLSTTEELRRRLATVTPILANAYWMGTLPPPAWWRHADESGGQFVEQTVHVVDLLRYLFGEASWLCSVATQQAITGLHADADVPDAGAAVLKVAQGFTATVINSCLSPVGIRTGVEVVSPTAYFEMTPSKLTVRTGELAEEFEPEYDPYVAEDTAFVEAVRSGNRAGIKSDYGDALRSHLLTMDIVASAKSGQPIER
jgi:predicted dehydrogenase